MGKIKEYLDLQKAKEIKRKLNKLLPLGVECNLEYKGTTYQPWKLEVKNKYGPTRELSEKENDIKELLNVIMDSCRKYYWSFQYSRHGLDYIYISIEVH